MTDDSTVTRVRSRDGTDIAVWTTGEGPPLVLVHGAPADHSRWRPLLPYLEPHVTVHALDRRGRGASGDGPEYDLAREFEDVVAVVDAVAEAAGSKVAVYGHSYGGLVAFGAATMTSDVDRLVLYEGWPLVDPSVLAVPTDLDEVLRALAAEGDHEAVLETFLREVLVVSDDDLRALRAMPSWQGRLAAAPALPRELDACARAHFDAAQAARLEARTLLVTGEDSRDPAKAEVHTLAAAVPDARVLALEGQQHIADIMVPEVFASHLLAFLREG